MVSKFPIDLAERVLATYFQAFFGLWIASGLGVEAVTNLDFWNRALVAVLPAVLSLIKGFLAKGVGSPNTAALLPVKDDTPVSVTGLDGDQYL